MKVAQYVADFIAKVSPRVYGVCGAGAMHLNDAIANHPGIQVIAMQHEQAAAMAAEAEARVTGQMSVVSVTTGPGATNAMTGVACAYVDSIPMLVIGGQVPTTTMIRKSSTRQIGMNELDGVSLMTPITRSAVTVTKPEQIRYELEASVYWATHGRKGPVFIEIPLDVQAAEIDPDKLVGLHSNQIRTSSRPDVSAAQCLSVLAKLRNADKPVVIIGNGVRLSKTGIEEFMIVFGDAGIPVVSSWGAADIMPTEHPCYIGRGGIFGDRASNFAVQNADVILAIGTRLSVGQSGHAPHLFASKAEKIIVDVDVSELMKDTVRVDIPIRSDAGDFIRKMEGVKAKSPEWLYHCAAMKRKYPSRGFNGSQYGISSYEFVEHLPRVLTDDAIVVTDVGFCFIPTFQRLQLREGQRLIHSGGVSPMGWGLPAAIGAALATNAKRQVVCLTGDGGLMLNLQELQTIRSWDLPVAIFVFENGGYATMKIAQNNHFKREVMAGPDSGLNLPEFVKIARAFGIKTKEFDNIRELSHELPAIMDACTHGPMVIVMHMDMAELIAPRLQARMQDGKFVPVDLSDMWPYLSKEETEENMRGVIDVVPDRTGSKVLAAN